MYIAQIRKYENEFVVCSNLTGAVTRQTIIANEFFSPAQVGKPHPD